MDRSLDCYQGDTCCVLRRIYKLSDAGDLLETRLTREEGEHIKKPWIGQTSPAMFMAMCASKAQTGHAGDILLEGEDTGTFDTLYLLEDFFSTFGRRGSKSAHDYWKF